MTEDNIQPIEETPAAVFEEVIEPAVVVEEPIVVHELAPEPVVELAPVVMEEAPAPAPEPVHVEAPKPKANKNPHVVVSGQDKDTVILANCVYKNVYARKSLTVHHVQRRLTDLGFNDANADKDGWFGDLTKLATSKFQESKGLPATGLMDAETFTKLFKGDPDVEVVI